MIEMEYQTAFLIPSALDLLLFKKKLTVTGINGNTQGVMIANKPVPKQIKKIRHNETDAALETGGVAAEILGSILSENFSSPLGKSVPDFANQVKLPFNGLFAVLRITNKY